MQPSGEGERGSGFGLIVLGLALALVGAGSVMLLVLALSHLYVAHYAAALGEIADPSALAFLEPAAGDPDPDVRKLVRWAIGRCQAAV